MSNPIIAWNNVLASDGVTYVVNDGNEDTGHPISEAWTWDLLRPAIVEASAAGVVRFTATLPASAGYADGYGTLAYGLGPYGGYVVMDTLVLGAARYESGGYRTLPTTVMVKVDGTTIISYTDIWQMEGASLLQQASSGLSGIAVEITLSGFAANELVTIPEIFLGPAAVMPPLDLGFDTYNEQAVGPTFVSESGRAYPQLRYRQIKQSPSWSVVPDKYWTDIDSFREHSLELRNPFFFCWQPDVTPYETYMVRHVKPSAPFSIKGPTHKSFALDLEEAL